MAKTPADVIDELGAATIASALGKRLGTVNVWKHRGQIPRSAWPELTKAFPKLTIDVLLKLEKRAA